MLELANVCASNVLTISRTIAPSNILTGLPWNRWRLYSNMWTVPLASTTCIPRDSSIDIVSLFFYGFPDSIQIHQSLQAWRSLWIRAVIPTRPMYERCRLGYYGLTFVEALELHLLKLHHFPTVCASCRLLTFTRRMPWLRASSLIERSYFRKSHAIASLNSTVQPPALALTFAAENRNVSSS